MSPISASAPSTNNTTGRQSASSTVACPRSLPARRIVRLSLDFFDQALDNVLEESVEAASLHKSGQGAGNEEHHQQGGGVLRGCLTTLPRRDLNGSPETIHGHLTCSVGTGPVPVGALISDRLSRARCDLGHTRASVGRAESPL